MIFVTRLALKIWTSASSGSFGLLEMTSGTAWTTDVFGADHHLYRARISRANASYTKTC